MRINQKIRQAVDPGMKTPCRATNGKPLPGRGWKYAVVAKHTYNGRQEDTYNIVDDDQWDPIISESYDDVTKLINELDNKIYYQIHNESDRPDYFVVGIKE